MVKKRSGNKAYVVQMDEEKTELLQFGPTKSDDNVKLRFWKSLCDNNCDDLKYIMRSSAGSFESFLVDFKEDMSCFDKLCSTPNMDECIHIFLDQCKNLLDKSLVERKYLNKKVDNKKGYLQYFNKVRDAKKGPLQYAISAGNLDSVCYMCIMYEISNANILKSINLISKILEDKYAVKEKLEKYQNVISHLLEYETKFTTQLWNSLFEFATKNYTQTTLDVLVGFILDVNLDPSVEGAILVKVSEKTRLAIKLFRLIQNEDEEMFANHMENISQCEEQEFSEVFCIKKKFYTLLQLACEKGMTRVVETLLETSVDRNFGGKKNVKPIFVAFTNGHHKVLSLLLADEKVVYNREVLNVMLNELIFQNKLNDDNEKKYTQCVNVLKGDKRVCVMTVCSILLIKTIDSSSESTVLFLLRNGASLNFTYEPFHNDYVLENLSTKTLETFFDECLVPHREKNVLFDEVFIEINYACIKPIILKHQFPGKDDKMETQSEEILPEMEILLKMSKIPHLRPLMKHPVIQSFLHLKWQKVKSFFYLNFLYFMSFWIVLMVHIFLEKPDKDCNPVTIILLKIFLVAHVLKDIFQFCKFPLFYLKNWENWLSILIILTTALITFYHSDYFERMHFGIFAIFLTSSKLVLLMAHFPTFAVYFTMLKKVTWNFFRFMAAFFIIFICFAEVFYKIFQNTSNNSSNNQTEPATGNNTSTKYDYFVSFERSLFKTVVMFTGELEASSFEYGNFPYMSYVMLIIFIFIVTIVLYNFLNGIAISDIQAIKNDAELVSLSGRTEVMSYAERLVFGIELEKDSSVDKSWLRKVYRTIFSRKDLYHARIRQPRFTFLAKCVCLFPDINQYNKIKVSLNRPLKGRSIFYLKYWTNDVFGKVPVKIYPMDKKVVNLAHLKIKEKFETEKIIQRKQEIERKLNILEGNQKAHDAVLSEILKILRNNSIK